MCTFTCICSLLRAHVHFYVHICTSTSFCRLASDMFWIPLKREANTDLHVQLVIDRCGSSRVLVRCPWTLRNRVKYFGLANVSCCGLCRRRKGRSAMRTATPHCVQDINNLYDVATDTKTRPGYRKRARDRLHRHGFDYKKRCRLTKHAQSSLIHGQRTVSYTHLRAHETR